MDIFNLLCNVDAVLHKHTVVFGVLHVLDGLRDPSSKIEFNSIGYQGNHVKGLRDKSSMHWVFLHSATLRSFLACFFPLFWV